MEAPLTRAVPPRASRLSLALAASCVLITATLPMAPARAATATSVMAVSATVLSLCTITALPLVFGNYTGVTTDATTTLTVLCTATTSFSVGLDAGVAPAATVSTRQMQSGAATLAYALYRDTARTNNWGITVGTDTLAGAGTGLPQLLTVYGRIPPGQLSAPGVYTDVVTATITY